MQKSMKFIILCFSLVLLPLTTSAGESRQPYWVIGSFISWQNATNERHRLENKSGIPILIATSDGQTRRHRLVVAKNLVSETRIKDEGITPWTLSVAESELEIPMQADEAHKVETATVNYYLVLSSFRNVVQADSFADRMHARNIQPVEISIADVNNKTFYRVIYGPFDKKVESIRDRYNDIGDNKTWWLAEPKREPVQVEPEPEMQPTAIASLDALVPESMLKGPEPGEYYAEYCSIKANAAERDAYCSDDQVGQELTQTLELLSMNNRDFAMFCTNAPGRDRMRFCTNAFSDRRVDR